MSPHQKRIIRLANRQFVAITDPAAGEMLTYRTAGRGFRHVEFMMKFSCDGHTFAARAIVNWWATEDNVFHNIVKLVRAMRDLRDRTLEELCNEQ